MTDDRRADDGRERREGPVTTPSDEVRWPDAGTWESGSPDDAEQPPSPRDGGDGDPPWPHRPTDRRHDAPEPPRAFAVPWSWTDGLLLVAWFIVAQVVVATIAVEMGVDPFADATGLFLVLATSQVVVFAGALVGLALRGGLSWRLLGPLRPQWGRHSLIGVGIGLSGWVIVTLLLAMALRAIDREALPTQDSLELLAAGDGVAIALGILSAVILAPIVEEFVYRGVLFQALRERIGLWPGMVISAVLFGAVHLDTVVQADGVDVVGLIPMMGIVLLGIWLAAAFHRTGSLVVPVMAHAVFNAVALTLLTMGRDDLELPTGLAGPIARVLTGT